MSDHDFATVAVPSSTNSVPDSIERGSGNPKSKTVLIQVAVACLLVVTCVMLFVGVPDHEPGTNTDFQEHTETVSGVETQEVKEPTSKKTPPSPTVKPKTPGFVDALLGRTDNNSVPKLKTDQFQVLFKDFFKLKKDIESEEPKSPLRRNAHAMYDAIRANAPGIFLNGKIAKVWAEAKTAEAKIMTHRRRIEIQFHHLPPLEKRLVARTLSASDVRAINKLKFEVANSERFEEQVDASLKVFFGELRKLNTPFTRAAFEPAYLGRSGPEGRHPLARYLTMGESGMQFFLGRGFDDLWTDKTVLKKTAINFPNPNLTAWEKAGKTAWQQELRRRARNLHSLLSLDDYDKKSFASFKKRNAYTELLEELKKVIPPELPPKYRAELFSVYQLYLKERPKRAFDPGAYLQDRNVLPLRYTHVRPDMTIVFADGTVFSTLPKSKQ